MSVKCKALRSPWMSFPGGHRLSEAPLALQELLSVTPIPCVHSPVSRAESPGAAADLCNCILL